jgi:hypothetical protein
MAAWKRSKYQGTVRLAHASVGRLREARGEVVEETGAGFSERCFRTIVRSSLDDQSWRGCHGFVRLRLDGAVQPAHERDGSDRHDHNPDEGEATSGHGDLFEKPLCPRGVSRTQEPLDRGAERGAARAPERVLTHRRHAGVDGPGIVSEGLDLADLSDAGLASGRVHEADSRMNTVGMGGNRSGECRG